MADSMKISDRRGSRMYEQTPAEELRELCEKNDTWAMIELSRRYATGAGIDRNQAKSEELLKRSAINGNGWAKVISLYGKMGNRKDEYREEAEKLCVAGNHIAFTFYSSEYGIDYYRRLSEEELKAFIGSLVSEGDSETVYDMFKRGYIGEDELRGILHPMEDNIDRLCLTSLESMYWMYRRFVLFEDTDRISEMIADAAEANYSGKAKLTGTTGIDDVCRIGLTDSTRKRLESLMERFDADYDEDKDRYGLKAHSIAVSYSLLGNTEKAKEYAMKAIVKGNPFLKEDLISLLPKDIVIEECVRNAEDNPLLYGTLVKLTDGEDRIRFAVMGARYSDVRCLSVLRRKFEEEGDMDKVIACVLRNPMSAPTEEMLDAMAAKHPGIGDLRDDRTKIISDLRTNTPLRKQMLESYPLEI